MNKLLLFCFVLCLGIGVLGAEEACMPIPTPREVEIDRLTLEIRRAKGEWVKANNRRKYYKRAAEQVLAHDQLEYRIDVEKERYYEQMLIEMHARITDLEMQRQQLVCQDP